jgi:hypothetical protein
MTEPDTYTDELRKMRSLLIVASLQQRSDLKAVKLIKAIDRELAWEPLEELMIDEEVWDYAVRRKGYNPKLVFCHPGVLTSQPQTSLYYRGLCGLSLKAARDYFGAVDNLESGNQRARLSEEKALRMSRVYNTFICSLIRSSTAWTLENGKRTIIATLGITLDGKMRNRIGEIAEDRIRTLVVEWLMDRRLVLEPKPCKQTSPEKLPTECVLRNGVTMRFGSEPDIAFTIADEYLAVVEIKGGIDPAGALERYGAATKSFQHATSVSPHCQTYFLTAVFTDELTNRINKDRLVDRSFNIVEMLDNPDRKEEFLSELFHHTLRLV